MQRNVARFVPLISNDRHLGNEEPEGSEEGYRKNIFAKVAERSERWEKVKQWRKNEKWGNGKKINVSISSAKQHSPWNLRSFEC